MSLICARSSAVLSTLAGALFLTGCGGDAYKTALVEGTVLCNGKPAAGGIIVFNPVNDPAKTGRPNGQPGLNSGARVGADGKFKLELGGIGRGQVKFGALIGAHKVAFQLPRTKPVEIDADAAADMSAEELQKIKEDLETQNPVYPEIDCGSGTEPDTVDVKPGQNSFEFTLLPRPPEQTYEKRNKKARVGR